VQALQKKKGYKRMELTIAGSLLYAGAYWPGIAWTSLQNNGDAYERYQYCSQQNGSSRIDLCKDVYGKANKLLQHNLRFGLLVPSIQILV
jgi:hypothetical protein